MTYYSELGLGPSASHRAVCTAYRQKALQTHPDKGGTHDAYVRVRQAFEVLSDQRLRAEYDAELRAAGQDADEPTFTPTASATGSGAPSASTGQPLALMGDTPWQEAARTVVGMMDLPESAWAAALELHTAEVLECCRRQLHRSREAPNLRGQAAKESAAVNADGPAVRGLYQTKRGSWEVSLSIRKVQCAIFNVHDIERAHDWHVALVELRRKVDEKARSAASEREAFREALEETYEADPELKLVLSFRVSIREAKKVINGPFTHRLETALQLRNRVQQLRDMRGSSQDIDKEIRDAKTYEKKQRDLQKARQAAMLQEVLAVLEHLRREEAARQRQTAPLALPAPPADEASEAPEAPAAPAAPEVPQAETDGREGQAEGYAVPVKGFAKFCRAMSLSKPQREQLLKRVQDDMEVQNCIREAIVRHCGNLRGAPALKDKAVSVPAIAGRSERGCSALVPYGHGHRGSLSAPRKKGLLELLLEKHEGVFCPGLLTLCELVRVTTTSRRAYSASAGATKRQLANFRIADFGRHTARSKRGRALPGGELRELRMLRECLRTRRFALQIQHLDLSTLEMSSISKQDFQYMLGCLPNLVSVIFPSKGWAGTLQLRTFVNIAKSLKVSIGALKSDYIILRGAAQRPDEPRPAQAVAAGASAPSRKRPRAEVANEPRPRRSRREVQTDSDALGFRAAAEDLRRSSGRDILVTSYTPPVVGQASVGRTAPLPELAETPELQPAVQALRSGGLRRRNTEKSENQRDSDRQDRQDRQERQAGSHSFWWPERH
ncbi:DNAJ1 [Symbiodinium natans]|uniref:DNAJ1 protein n=1 Tax=Symbiodinium natans TaxID=878477 RepID=A0A812KJ31_9DINO|nr:DNAJ1 [Symbiodinium natans]